MWYPFASSGRANVLLPESFWILVCHCSDSIVWHCSTLQAQAQAMVQAAAQAQAVVAAAKSRGDGLVSSVSSSEILYSSLP